MICGTCGNDPINGTKDDDGGMCGKCGSKINISGQVFC